MDNAEVAARFSSLTMPLVADAVLRVGAPFRIGPFGIRPANARTHAAGRALPVRHYGSVDVFLEAFETANPGDVLQSIPIAVFSLGSCAAGPRRLDSPAGGVPRFGEVALSKDDFVFADVDGVLFVDESRVADVLSAAEAIFATERRQADAIRAGKSLRRQLRFSEYLEERKRDASYTLRRHLQKIGGAIEV